MTTWWLLCDNLVTHLGSLGDIIGSPLVAGMIEGGLRDSLIHQEGNSGPGRYGTFDADAQSMHQKVITRFFLNRSAKQFEAYLTNLNSRSLVSLKSSGSC